MCKGMGKRNEKTGSTRHTGHLGRVRLETIGRTEKRKNQGGRILIFYSFSVLSIISKP
jgi:hypothetical protein